MVQYAGDAVLAMANAGCYRCQRGSDLVDMDVHIVAEGALALCRNCLGEGAQAAGLIFNRAVVDELNARVLTLQSEVRDARVREARFEHALAAALEDPCAATTASGNPCKNKALPDSETCLVHAPEPEPAA